jgi:hypothetical protein
MYIFDVLDCSTAGDLATEALAARPEAPDYAVGWCEAGGWVRAVPEVPAHRTRPPVFQPPVGRQMATLARPLPCSSRRSDMLGTGASRRYRRPCAS